MPRVGAETRPKTWSNPQGGTLTTLRENVWVAERPFYPTIPGLTGVDVGGKMAVVKLPDGSLWVHSPVELDDALRLALAELGEVKHIVTPNTEHQKWARQWIEAYPGAASYACPGLRRSKPGVGWTKSIGSMAEDSDRWTSDVPAEWGGAFELCWIDAEHGPLMWRPFFSEVVFCHRPSKSLFVTDLYWNYPSGSDVPFGTRAWKWALDAIYAPFYNAFMMKRPLFDERLAMVNRWDWDYIVPCHGEPVVRDAKQVLSNHLGF